MFVSKSYNNFTKVILYLLHSLHKISLITYNKLRQGVLYDITTMLLF